MFLDPHDRSARPDDAYRILLVEDDDAQARLTVTMLQTTASVAFAVDRAASMAAALDRLSRDGYDVVLLDLGLPDAHELGGLVRIGAVAPDLPLVILTSTESERLALEAVKQGAQDYLIKGQATPESLVRAIRYAVERKHSERTIRYLAYYDSLTGLPNRRLLLEHLGQAVTRAARSGGIVGVFFIDVDRFKHINDAFGHAVGDSVLAQLAARLKSALRASDTLGRLSGDEFVAVVDVGQPRELAVVAESLHRCLHAPFSTPEGPLCTTISVGVSAYPADGEEVDDLLRGADRAMYLAKQRGRDAVCFSTRSGEPTR